MKKLFEVSVYVVVIVVGIFEIYSHAAKFIHDRSAYVHNGSQLSSLSKEPPAYEPWKEHDKTLLLVVQAGCQYCEKSMPFYQTLAGLQKDHKADAFIEAVFPNNANTSKEAMNVFDLALPYTSDVDFAKLKISGTPTLLLVNKSGRVENTWVGQLSPDQENDVKKRIGSGS